MDQVLPENIKQDFPERFNVYVFSLIEKTIRVIVPILADFEVKFVQSNSQTPSIIEDIATLSIEEYTLIDIVFYRENKDFRAYTIPEEIGYFCDKVGTGWETSTITNNEQPTTSNPVQRVTVTEEPTTSSPTKYFSIMCLNSIETISIRLPREVTPLVMVAAFTPHVSPAPTDSTETTEPTGNCGLIRCPERNHGYLSLPFFPDMD